jgi:hypothetical protein
MAYHLQGILPTFAMVSQASCIQFLMFPTTSWGELAVGISGWRVCVLGHMVVYAVMIELAAAAHVVVRERLAVRHSLTSTCATAAAN